jgi:hypothetical protein
MIAALDINAMMAALGGQVTGRDSGNFPGPGHSAGDRSASLKLDPTAPEGFVVHSFAGDDPIAIRDHVRDRCKLPQWKPGANGGGRRGNASAHARCIAEHIYRDADGEPYLRVLRLQEQDGGKSYPQYHLENGKWVRGKPRGPKIPYRLPELLKADVSAPVFICEGEKCADAVAAHGLVATSASEGACKWTPDLNECFAGRIVYILADNDEPGRKHVEQVARNLYGIAADVRIVAPPGLAAGEDVFDWLERGNTAETLMVLGQEASPWKPAVAPITETCAGVSLDDFRAYMPAHSYIYVPTREMWPASSINVRIPPLVGPNGNPIQPATWLDRERPVEQMTWAPGEAMLIKERLIADGGWIERKGVTCFNLYRPPTIEHGDATKAGAWLDHVRKVYPDDADHIITWCAHRVQRPHEKINHGLVLGGAQGIGKDTILEPVKRAVGPWNFHEVSPQQMLGRFNGFLKSVVMRINEARDLGDVDRYQFYEHTKAYLAAPPDVLRVDEKNLREHSVINCVGVIITTNHKTDGIYLPADDRRHLVGWSYLTKEDFTSDYWRKLWGFYDDGGDRHVAAYLATLDISGFDPKAPPPKTPAFWDIVDANRAPEDAELADALDAMGAPEATTIARITSYANGELSIWIQDRKNRRAIPHRLERCGYLPVRNDAAQDGLWKINGRRQAVYAKSTLSIRDRIGAAGKLGSQ